MVRGFAEAGAWLPAFARRSTTRGEDAPAEPASEGSNQPALPFGSTGPHGHRRRMRERLLGAGPASLADYEILEMLLFLGIPRRDTKPLAKALINRFGSLPAVLGAPAAALRGEGLSEACAAVIGLAEPAAARLSGAEARDRPMLNNWERLMAYFDAALTGAVPGQLRILFLDNRNRLLADEVAEQAAGAVPTSGEEVPDVPRQAMRRALDLHATALIAVRVVPAGTPSSGLLAREAALASRLSRAAAPLAIILHDHMLVGGDNWVSLRQKKLI